MQITQITFISEFCLNPSSADLFFNGLLWWNSTCIHLIQLNYPLLNSLMLSSRHWNHILSVNLPVAGRRLELSPFRSLLACFVFRFNPVVSTSSIEIVKAKIWNRELKIKIISIKDQGKLVCSIDDKRTPALVNLKINEGPYKIKLKHFTPWCWLVI